MSHKVALLIPSTTHERNWQKYSDTDLYKINMKSFLLTYCHNHSYTYYIGIDEDDKINSDPKQQEAFKRFINIMKNVDIQFISMKNIKKGHLTAMWNRLFRKAYEDGCEYFYQCGDDIQFLRCKSASIHNHSSQENIMNSSNFIIPLRLSIGFAMIGLQRYITKIYYFLY